jgi:hypothetical protein
MKLDLTQLKPLSREAIPAALERAERYRLLNEPSQAESICLDILSTEPQNQEATIMLLLALTDQFGDHSDSVARAREVLARLKDEYQRAYYGGLICERQARCVLRRNSPGAGPLAYDYFEDAMELYDRAAGLRPPGNDEAVLRWNCCARTIMADRLEPAPADDFTPMLE